MNDEVREQLRELEADSESGASELQDKAIEIIKNQLSRIQENERDIKDIMLPIFRKITEARPSMAPMINLIGYLMVNTKDMTKSSLLGKIEKLQKKLKEITESLRLNFNNFLKKYNKSRIKIMLISHSSTILTLLDQLEGNELEIYVLESRPLCEGRKTAELLSSKYRVHLIIDAAMGYYIDRIDIILIGIDSILKNGSIINKIGSYPLCVIAKTHHKKVYAVGSSFKYNLRSHFDLEIQIERKPPEEVYGARPSAQEVIIHNKYFESVPAEYIDGIISDLGIYTPSGFLEKIIYILPIEWFNSFLKNPN